jgi:hypothetical protein
MHRSKKGTYSITWVAAKGGVGRTAMPSSFAACVSMASWNLVGR